MRTDSEYISAARPYLDAFHGFQREGLICRSGDFFPSGVHYPPITMYSPISEEDMFAGYTLPADGLFDVYVHLPFCIGHCVFCHYPVKLGERFEEKERYLDALEREYRIYMDCLGVDRLKVRSVLVGGGTPTYLAPSQLERFLKTFVSCFDLTACTQFNYDLDPSTMLGDAGSERLRILRTFGVDRLTVGVQSFSDDILSRMNRHHDAQEARHAVERSLDLGFTTNIEFIYGYPGETLANWISVIREAASTGVHEIQLYRLKIEPYGDRAGSVQKRRSAAPEEFPSVDESIQMKRLAHLVLNDHGYDENLIRVFSRRREDYSHYADNQCCKLRDQVGFGLTAFSSLRDRLVLNTQHFAEYYDAVAQGRLPLNRGLVRNRKEQMRWALVLPLKNRNVRKDAYRMQTGEDLDSSCWRARIERLATWGLVQDGPGVLGLTPFGRFFADEIVTQFHASAYIPSPPEDYETGPLNPYRKD